MADAGQQEAQQVARRLAGRQRLLGQRDAELLLQAQHQLDAREAVEAELLLERSCRARRAARRAAALPSPPPRPPPAAARARSVFVPYSCVAASVDYSHDAVRLAEDTLRRVPPRHGWWLLSAISLTGSAVLAWFVHGDRSTILGDVTPLRAAGAMRSTGAGLGHRRMGIGLMLRPPRILVRTRRIAAAACWITRDSGGMAPASPGRERAFTSKACRRHRDMSMSARFARRDSARSRSAVRVAWTMQRDSRIAGTTEDAPAADLRRQNSLPTSSSAFILPMSYGIRRLHWLYADRRR